MGNNQIEPYKMEKLKLWDKPYKPERREYSLCLGEYKSPYENQVFPKPLGVEH